MMRVLPILTMTAALAVAQEQVPFGERVQNWISKIKDYIPSPTPVVPVGKVAEKVVQKTVTPFKFSNYQELLEPESEPKDWLVYITGGNKSCFGRCGNADKAFNVSTFCCYCCCCP